MAKVARGKALVAKLAGQAGVRDPEALAAHLGRYRKARKSGKSVAEAQKIAKGRPSDSKTKASPKDPKDVFRNKKPLVQDEDDPFAEDFGDDEPKSKEDLARGRLEAKLIADMEKADRQKVYRAIQDQGGLKTRPDLREEYAGIPNTFKRKDGLPGDEMADHLATYYPELGIESERDLITYLAA